MLSNHGEYISVRHKKQGESNADHCYEKKSFNTFEAYIVRPSNPLINLMSPQDKLRKSLRENISLALRNDIEYKEIQHILDGCLWTIDGQMRKFITNIFYIKIRLTNLYLLLS